MDAGKIIDALWEAARDLGLLSRWEFWVVVVVMLGALTLKKLGFFPAVPTDAEGLPSDSPKAPPMDMPPGGMPLDQKPKGPDDWAG
jgi:hypothetical protein